MNWDRIEGLNRTAPTTRRRSLTPRTLHRLTLLTAVVGTLGLVACGQQEADPTVGQQIDNTIAQAEQKAAEVRASAESTANEVKADMAEASQGMVNTVKDAAITTAVKAELARDSSLSALDINVDTEAGRVLLRGTAPDAAARDRAHALAKGVDGVVAVSNELVIKPS